MRRAIILIGVLFLWTMSVRSQVSPFLELSAGGGWSTLTYSLKDVPESLTASQTGSYGLSFHVGGGLMFNSYVGLGTGVDVSRYGATAHMSGEMVWRDVTDSDGERYDHYTQVNRWDDRQELYYVEVPLALYFLIPTPSIVSVSVEIGVKYAYPFLRNASYHGNVSHRGQYGDWGMTVTDMPNHGFYTTDLSGKSSLSLQHQVTAFAKLGVMLPISQQIYFFSHLYASCGLRKAIATGDSDTELGFREETDDAAEMHYFMNPATSVLATNMPSGTFLPVSVGLEIGVRFCFASRGKKYPCRCMTDDDW